jgi:hypothetical protein
MNIKEPKILKRIQLLFTSFGARIFRNNVGMLEDKRGQKVKYGLCTGSGDLIGWVPMVVTPEMVGKRIAVFTSVEIKTKNARTNPSQLNWMQAVNTAGGIAMIEKEPVNVMNKLLEIMKEYAQPNRFSGSSK